MQYRRDIDGLRAIAVITVILFHAGWKPFSGGFVGVDVFFLISGYLITSILLNDLAAGTFSFAAFYERRARRILPALLFITLCCFPLAWVTLLSNEFVGFAESVLSIFTFTSNYYFRATLDYFGPQADEKPLLHTWSLSVEEQYYIFFPLLIAMLWRYGRGTLALTTSALGLMSLLYAQFNIRFHADQIFFDTRARVWELILGGLIAIYSLSRRTLRAPRWISQCLSIAGLALIMFAVLLFDELTPSPSLWTLIPVVGAALILLFSAPETVAGKLLGSPALVGIGLISYSAYLWHQPIFTFVRLREDAPVDDPTLILSCLVVLVLAYATWRYVEQPFRNRGWLSRRSIFRITILATCSMVLLATAGIYSGGPKSTLGHGLRIAEDMVELRAERTEITRAGLCQYNTRMGASNIHDFVQSWTCDTDPLHPELKKIPVIVIGDSHSADIAAAFRANGLLPAQIGAPGCSVVPARMGSTCRYIFEFIKEFAKNNSYYKYIFVANRWDKNELEEQNLKELASYWSIPEKQLVVVTSRPEFGQFARSLRKGSRIRTSFSRANASSAPSVVNVLSELGVKVVNAKELFCSITSDCGWKDANGRLLTTDGNHLTKHGAKLFGEKMLALNIIPVPENRVTYRSPRFKREPSR